MPTAARRGVPASNGTLAESAVRTIVKARGSAQIAGGRNLDRSHLHKVLEGASGRIGTIDLNVGYDIMDNLRLDVGAQNLFNTYPNETDPQARLNFDKYSHLSPYGINGGYYYVKLTSTF